MRKERQRAWQTYFNTGDKDPLVRAYQKSIEYMVWDMFNGDEDMVQVGLMGLLKAIDRLDISRVKSVDAWVFLNVRGTMLNARKFKKHVSLDNFYDANEPYEIEIEEDFDTPVYVQNLLKRLPKRESLILRLIYFHDWKRTEVGKLLGVSSMRIGQLEQRSLNFLSSIA
jgi:RNA polymerase sigma factor (sigma-70 family)